MKTKLAIKPFLILLLATALLATASGPACAETKKEPIEKFRARIFDSNRGRTTNLDIVIYEWTTPEERQALIKTLADRGSRALNAALRALGAKGSVKPPQVLGYDMQYVWQVEVEGKRRIVLATDRPMDFLELSRNTRSTDYKFSLVVLELDPQTGQGEGTAMGGAELSIDETTGRLQIEVASTKLTKLTKVKSALPDKKKKGK